MFIKKKRKKEENKELEYPRQSKNYEFYETETISLSIYQ